MTRFALVLLTLTFVGCDGEAPEAPVDAVLALSVRTADGAPAAGLDVAAVYGGSSATSRVRTASGAVTVLGPYPSPATGAARLNWSSSAAGPVRVVAYDVAGRQQAVLFDGAAPAGTHSVAFDLAGWPAGVYRVRTEAAGEAVETFLLRTVDGQDPGSSALTLPLGRTDADGRLALDDSTRFPALFGGPEWFEVRNENASALGQIRVGRAFELVLRDADGRTDAHPVVLPGRGTALDLRFAP